MDKNSCGTARKICVIAGAGAEVPYDIEDGLNFAKKTTGIMDENTRKDIEQMNMAIKEHYNCCLAEVSDDKKIWYPDNHCNTNLQIQQLLKAAIIDKRVENIEESTNKQNQHKIDAELIKKYSDNYKSENRNPDIDSEMNELLKRYISYKGIFDKEFSSLLSPRSFGKNGFWKIINMYTRSYLCIVKDILYGKEYVTKDGYLKFLNEPLEILNQVNDKCRVIDNQYAYYQLLNGISNVSLVTTNYTPLALLKSGIAENNIAYVNGKIGWFESAYQMRTFDLGKRKDIDDFNKEKDLYFPYIFTQSSTKPIVEEKMVGEYLKMSKFIEKSQRIIILGYNINSDDNHLNGQIRKAAVQGKEIIYMAYESKKGEVGITEKQLCSRLHIDDKEKYNIKYIKYRDNSVFDKWLKK